MHASDGRSSKPVGGSTLTAHLKSGPDNVQNTGSPFSFQGRGKKRERGDEGLEPIKRERSGKIDADFISLTAEKILKSEIVKITERGGLVDMEGVEKLVQLILSEKSERKIDLSCRSLLASVIAASDNFDCLNRFVQLKGLPVLDEWLQEAHKGKVGEGRSLKDNDKCVEEFLSVLLRALDKLPVNLNALQTCNIGKSVNLLRSHKNLEIQKKSRSLVDTWKKRVQAEMNSHEAKSGSCQVVPWSARTRHSETSHDGNRQIGVSSEAAIKSSLALVSASRTNSSKQLQTDTVKSVCASIGQTKLVMSPMSGGTNSKDGQIRDATVCGASDPLPTAGKEEKSSSSSHSHNNSQSCSSDHAKTLGFQVKDDARSSTAGSRSVNKLVSGFSRHRKSVDGWSNLSGTQRESGPSRSPLHRTLALEKISQSGLTCENVSDMPVAERSVQKLVVKIPNRSKSPAQNLSVGGFEDPSIVNIQASSPVSSAKHEHDLLDHNLRERSDSFKDNITSDVKTESWQSNDIKDAFTGSDEGGVSPAAAPDEEHCRIGDDEKKTEELPKAASSSSGSEPKSEKVLEASFCSMNALIESCANFSEVNASVSAAADVVGMNLLATVAAGELSMSDNSCLKTNHKSDDLITPVSVSGVVTRSMVIAANGGRDKQCHEIQISGMSADRTSDRKFKVGISGEDADNISSEGEKKTVEVENIVNGVQKPPSAMIMREDPKKSEKEVVLPHSIFDKDASSSAMNGKETTDQLKIKTESNASPNPSNSVVGCFGSAVSDNKVEERIEDKDPPKHQSGGSALEMEECASTTPDNSSFSTAEASQMDTKLEFDLNEGFNIDDGKYSETINLMPPISVMSTLPFQVSSVPTTSRSSSITIAAAAKGPFLPREDLLKCKGELGWKGSAATSAFRPAEPRKALEMPLWDTPISKQSKPPTRPPLDIDLNIPHEKLFEDLTPARSCERLDFDLNRADEAPDFGQCSTSNSHRFLAPHLLPIKSSSPVCGRFPNFDLNNGPGAADDMNLDNHPRIAPAHNPSHTLANTPFTCIRMNSPDMGPYSSWYPPGNTYSAVTVPSILTDRGEPSFPNGAPRILGSYIGGSSRGPAFQYHHPPFGNAFHMTSSSSYVDGKLCFPAMQTHLLGPPPGSVSSQFPRPYIVSMPDGASESFKKWGKQGLDLNAGPAGGAEDEMRQFLVAGSQSLAEEQARMYQVAGGGGFLKRKDSEDSSDRFNFKQSSWQ